MGSRKSSLPASAVAGPSRIPYNSTTGSSWNLVVDNEDHLASPNLIGLKSPSTRNRSVSFQPPDLTSTPRSSRHNRRTSGGSHYSIRLSPPIRTPKSKAVVRKSLTRENALGMNINNRADILADVAGDCLVTLVKAALRAPDSYRRRSSVNDEAKKAWDGLFGIRQSYFFPPYSPPFPSFADTLRSLHSHIQSDLDAPALARAIDLSNLATFVWTISRPDEAGDQFHLDLNEDELPRRRSTRNKGRSEEMEIDMEILQRVKKRNSLLFMAWKKFWFIVVPQEKRTSEIALRLWLDFATQIALIYQQSRVEDHAEPSPLLSLPQPTAALLAELFSPSAVGRFGQWSILEDFDSQDYSQEKNELEERWGILAKRRTEELGSLGEEELRRRYDYDRFKTEMIAYVQHEVLASPANTLLTPRRRTLLANDYRDQYPFRLGIEDASSSDSDLDDTFLARRAQDSGIEEEEDDEADVSAKSEETPHEKPIDFDILALAAAEFEDEDADGVDQEFMHVQKDEMAEVEMQVAATNPEILSSSAEESGSSQEERIGVNEDEDEDWVVKDAVPTTDTSQIKFRSKDSAEHPSKGPRFDWTARQADAIQVEWDSQSLHENGLRSPDPGTGATRSTVGISGEEAETQTRNTTPLPFNPNIHSSVYGRLIETDPTAVPPHIRAQPFVFPPPPFPPTNGRSKPIPGLPLMEQLTPNEQEKSEEEEQELVEGTDTQNPAPSQRPPVDLLNDVLEDDEDEFADLLPSEAQLAPQSGDDRLKKAHGTTLRNGDLEYLASEPPHDDGAGQISVQTSQNHYMSSRPRKSYEAHSFVVPDQDEDDEDRQLLNQASSPDLSHRDWSEQLNVKSELTQDVLGLHRFTNGVHPSSFRRQRGSTVPYLADDEDPFLHDEDGTPLQAEDLYLAPVGQTSPRRSRIHGKTNTSLSGYCRLTGKRKWTKEEELLLYRTVQKVPLEEEYPLRIVWQLYGEFGRMGNQLKWYNTQHMKDKLRTTVKRRQNEGRKVEGRVRAWAARGTREREEWEEEWEEYKRFKGEPETSPSADDHEDGSQELNVGMQNVEEDDDTASRQENGDDADEEGNEIRSSEVPVRAEASAPADVGVDDDDFPEPTSLTSQPQSNPKDRLDAFSDDDFPEPSEILQTTSHTSQSAHRQSSSPARITRKNKRDFSATTEHSPTDVIKIIKKKARIASPQTTVNTPASPTSPPAQKSPARPRGRPKQTTTYRSRPPVNKVIQRAARKVTADALEAKAQALSSSSSKASIQRARKAATWQTARKSTNNSIDSVPTQRARKTTSNVVPIIARARKSTQAQRARKTTGQFTVLVPPTQDEDEDDDVCGSNAESDSTNVAQSNNLTVDASGKSAYKNDTTNPVQLKDSVENIQAKPSSDGVEADDHFPIPEDVENDRENSGGKDHISYYLDGSQIDINAKQVEEEDRKSKEERERRKLIAEKVKGRNLKSNNRTKSNLRI
ncbi:uncharacterized protein I206_102477 [Kwoniella pini CBS 10737]|uniref:Uncharacterized protein n=1 Tax=Kwoniella pini CBS 10737 TaxID=1296096 RepID=A0A1B9I5G7_9TREE|nr:uncharacterized protein I206_02828 [Kwoniella pini CBS 10737]OCF50772.1 hypothetical protein I206_02828 [Kwoniella pini CBS 10737]